jgi:hypothetical protein
MFKSSHRHTGAGAYFMCEKQWWSTISPFQSWKRCPTRPDPVEVLLFYMERRGIGSDERVTSLMDLLDLQKSMVYNIFKGDGFDAISRCRLLVQSLKIPPPLLGIDAKYFPIEQHPYWWRVCGFSFNADAEAHPVMSEVVAYLRMQRTQREERGRVKVWSQEDLGDATGLKKETVYRMEHDKNPLVLESMRRRAAVASALGTGAGEMEATIFRLFGLDPRAYGVPVSVHDTVPVLYLPHRRPTNEMLQGYQQRLAVFFREYSTSHAQNTVVEALEWVQHFSVLMQEAKTTAERVSLLARQSRTHRLLACVAREQCEKERILFHTAKAIESAEQAMTLSNTELGSDRAALLMTNELFASAWWTFALASYELGQYDLAQDAIDRALAVLLTVQSRHLKAEVLGAAALIHTCTVTGPIDQQKVLSCIHRAIQIHTLTSPQVDAPDDNFFQCGKGMLLIYKAGALSSPTMKGVTSESVLDLLEEAQRLTDPTLVRQHVMIGYLQALAYFEASDYRRATEVAPCALEKCRQIRSRLWKNRLEELYQRCLQTPFGDKPRLAYLGVKLRMWNYEID